MEKWSRGNGSGAGRIAISPQQKFREQIGFFVWPTDQRKVAVAPHPTPRTAYYALRDAFIRDM